MPPEELAAWRIFRTQYLAVRYPSTAGAGRDESVRRRQRHDEHLQRERDRKQTQAALRRRAERERRLAHALALLDDADAGATAFPLSGPGSFAASPISAISAISANSAAGSDAALAPDADDSQPNDHDREQDVDEDALGGDVNNRDEPPSQPDPESDPRYLHCLKLAEAVNTDNDSLLHSLLARLDAGTLPPPDLSPPATNVFVTPAPAAAPAGPPTSPADADTGAAGQA